MKTSTKILLVYASVFIAVQLVFLTNALVQYGKLKPIAVEMCETLNSTEIRHVEIDMSDPDVYAYETKGDRDLRWLVDDGRHRDEAFRFLKYIYLGANLKTSHVNSDTLYIKVQHKFFLFRQTTIPEIVSSLVITPDDTITKKYKDKKAEPEESIEIFETF